MKGERDGLRDVCVVEAVLCVHALIPMNTLNDTCVIITIQCDFYYHFLYLFCTVLLLEILNSTKI